MNDQTDGGCWLCGKVDKFLIYEEEFDTYVHVDCIRKALEDCLKCMPSLDVSTMSPVAAELAVSSL